MNIIRIILGIVLISTGQRLFWFFVAATGFLAGAIFAPQFFPGQPQWVILVVALLAGLVGALLAVFLQGLAIGLAGFIAGGYIVISLLTLINWNAGQYTWLFFVFGGILGAALVAFIFNGALIILSSLTGAILIVQSIPLGEPLKTAVLIVLVVAGLLIQGITLQRGPGPAG